MYNKTIVIAVMFFMVGVKNSPDAGRETLYCVSCPYTYYNYCKPTAKL